MRSPRLLVSAARNHGPYWTNHLIDQTAFSLSNFTLTFTIFRIAGEDEFGLFATYYSVFLLAQTIERAVVGEVILVRLGRGSGAGVDKDEDREDYLVAAAVAASIQIGVFFSVVVVLVGLAVDGHGPLMLCITIALPVLLAQDVLRHFHFGSQRPSTVATADTLWLALQLAGYAVLATIGSAEPTWYVLAWVGAGGTSVIIVARSSPLRPVGLGRHMMKIEWWRRQPQTLRHLLVDACLGRGGSILGQILAGIVVAPAVLGPIRLARSLMGPIQGLFAVAVSSIMPRAASLTHASTQQTMSLLRRTSYSLGALGSLYALVAAYALMPRQSDDETRNVAIALLALSPGMALQGIAFSGRIGLRVFDQTVWLLRLRLVTGPVTILATLVGAIWLGWLGVVLGSVVGSGVWVVSLEVALHRVLTQSGRDPVGEPLDLKGKEHHAQTPN